MSEKNIGVVLSGCGKFDGSEVHESVIALLAIDRAGHKAVCFAPNMSHHHVVNHLTGQVTEESRNVLEESARIARGDVSDLQNARAEGIEKLVTKVIELA
jgi:enhancing lycopene biosynthesis protein 2